MMKCLLIILVFRLVSADKLDRTYLPPLGAKLAGGNYDDLQTPLEFPKENPEVIRNVQTPGTLKENVLSGPADITQGLINGFPSSVAPMGYVPFANNNDVATETNTFLKSGYDSNVPTSSPDVSSYANFPPKPQNNGFSQRQNEVRAHKTGQSVGPTTSSNLQTTLDNIIDSGYNIQPGNYYLPETKVNETDKTNQALYFVSDNNNVLYPGFGQYPYQENNDYFPRNEPNVIPKITNAEDIKQNYQPNVYGFYGGSPMIMTSQNDLTQQIENMDLIPKFGYSDNNLNAMKMLQDLQNVSKVISPHPFQTPLVGTHALNDHKLSVPKISSSLSSNADQEMLPITTEIYPSLLEVNQRSNVPTRSKFIPERPQAKSDISAVIQNYEKNLTPDGYSYSYDTSNGIHADETATTLDGVKAKGSYSYIGDDGKTYKITYTADENGFRPSGDHLPTPPPIPKAIQKVIEQAVKDKAAGIIHDGFYDEKRYGHMNYQGAMDHVTKNNNIPSINRRKNFKFNQPYNVQEKPVANIEFTDRNVDNKTISNDGMEKTNNKQNFSNQLPNRHPENSFQNDEKIRRRLNSQINRGTSNTIPVKGQSISSRRRPSTSSKVLQQTVFNNSKPNKNNSLRNKINNGNDIKSQARISTQGPNQDEGQFQYKNDIPSSTRTRYNPSNKEEIPRLTNRISQTQTPVITYNPERGDGKLSYYNPVQRDQILQSNPSSNDDKYAPVSNYNNGYYYVPPKYKFKQENPLAGNFDQTFYKTPNYILTTVKPMQQNIDRSFNKATTPDGIQEGRINDFVIPSNRLPTNEDTVRTTTRKPYISGPNDHVGVNYFSDTHSLGTNSNDENGFNMYTNDLDSSYLSTTPISPQDDGYSINQYYQTTINPGYDSTLPNAIENKRTFIPNDSRGLSVTQNFVTTTDRPINLEVHQNVKVYPGTKPTTVQYPNVHSTYNDGFYTKAYPQEELRFSRPGEQFTAPIQDERSRDETDQFPAKPQEKLQFSGPDRQFIRPAQDGRLQKETDLYPPAYYGSEVLNASGPVQNGFTGSFIDADLERLPGLGTVPSSEIPTSIDNRDSELKPEQEQTTVNYTTENQSVTQSFMGEDYSGPQQPQRYDAETGYYYR